MRWAKSIYEQSKSRAWPSSSAVAVITAIASRLHAAIVAAARHADDVLSKWLIRFTSPWSVTCLLVSWLAHRASELHVWVSFAVGPLEGNVESSRERSPSQRLSHLPPEQL